MNLFDYIAHRRLDYSEDQPRDDLGRFGEGIGGAGGKALKGAHDLSAKAHDQASHQAAAKAYQHASYALGETGVQTKEKDEAAKKAYQKAQFHTAEARKAESPKAESPKAESPKAEPASTAHETAKFFKQDPKRLERIEKYSGGHSQNVNEYMLTGKASNPKIKELAQQLNKDLKTAPKSPGVVFRGMGLPQKTIDQMLIKKEVTLKNFSSTSKDLKVAESFTKGIAKGHQQVVLHMQQKNGVDISKLSKYAEEKEVLLPPGRKFSVGRTETKGNVLHIHLDEQ